MDYDVIIIGGGPAGLTAGLYTSRAMLKTLVIESFMVPGQAVIADRIENYPGFPEGVNGFDLVDKFKKQAEKFGVEFTAGNIIKINECQKDGGKGWEVKLENKSVTSLSLIAASGARYKELGVPGEAALRGRGVSYCATCDGALYRDKNIAVLGGGNSALEEALFLTRFGRKVTLIHRRDMLRAAKILQERVFANQKIEIVWDSVVTEIEGKDRVESLKVRNLKTNEENNIPCDGVFVSIGYIPNTDFIKDIVKLDDKGYIVTDDDMNTAKEGIFACGDCRKKLLRQVITACGDGATAAFASQQYVEDVKGIAYK
jgi:thioredoxin reductase (NADPH)